MRSRLTAVTLATAALVVAGCSSSDTTTTDGTSTTAAPATSAPASSTSSSTSSTQANGAFEVMATESPYGEILVDAEGHTLYVFLNDSPGEASACTGGCADAWPPAEATEVLAGTGVSEGVLGITDDGQVTAGGNRLYYFVGDEAPGDSNGNGTGGVWFVTGPDGEAIQDKA